MENIAPEREEIQSFLKDTFETMDDVLSGQHAEGEDRVFIGHELTISLVKVSVRQEPLGVLPDDDHVQIIPQTPHPRIGLNGT